MREGQKHKHVLCKQSSFGELPCVNDDVYVRRMTEFPKSQALRLLMTFDLITTCVSIPYSQITMSKGRLFLRPNLSVSKKHIATSVPTSVKYVKYFQIVEVC